MRLGVNVTTSRVNDRYILFENRAGFEGGVFQNAANLNPTHPVMANDTTYYEPGGNSLFNPVALANQITDLGKTTRTLANGTAEIDLVPGLTGQVTVGLDYSAGGRQIYFPIANPLGRTLGNGLARVYSQDNNTKTVQTLLTYRKQVGENHSLDVVGGYEYSKFTKTVAMGQGIGFVTDALLYNSLNAAQSLQDSTDGNESRLVSFLSRANYGYKDKFFVTGVLRYDGSSKFAEGHKWALFPGLSASWHLTKRGSCAAGRSPTCGCASAGGVKAIRASSPISHCEPWWAGPARRIRGATCCRRESSRTASATRTSNGSKQRSTTARSTSA